MKVLEKVRHVADVGAAESVDGLIVITNRENRIQRRTVWPELLTSQDFEPAVLQNVGILKLVDENMTEALLIVRANKVIAGEQLVAAKQQFSEIHHSLLLTFPLVSLVKPETQVGGILRRNARRPQSVFFAPINEIDDLLGIRLFHINIGMLAMTTTNPEAVNQVYNTAFGERTTLNQLVDYLKEFLSDFDSEIANIEVTHGPNRLGDIPHSLACIDKAKKLLHYNPKYSMRDGLKEAVKWYWENI